MGKSRPASFALACCAALLLGPALLATAANAGATPTARGSGHLTVVSVQPGGSWSGMDPFAPYVSASTIAMFPVFDSLFSLDPRSDAVLSDSLATGYRVGSGGRTITITLRHGVRFQDGTPFNAAAVVWNLERSANPSVGSDCASALSPLSSVVASGPEQVTLKLSARDAGLIPLLATQPCALMVSPTAYETEGSAFASAPVGTGPYVYAGGVNGTLANFLRSPTYWGSRPLLDEISFQAVNSNAAALAAVQSGSAQAWLSLGELGASPELVVAKRDPNLLVSSGPAAAISYVCFSFASSPFDNPVARQAVTAATDAKAIDATLFHNLFRPVVGVFPPASWAYAGGKVKGSLADQPSKATALLKQLGALSFTLSVANTPTQLQLAEALQAQWRSLGINAQIAPEPVATLATDQHTQNYEALLTSSPALPDPDNMVYPWFYSASTSSLDGVKSPAVDGAILAGRADYGRASRTASYVRLNNALVALDPWDDVAAIAPYAVTAKTLRGISVTPYARFAWAGVRFTR